MAIDWTKTDPHSVDLDTLEDDDLMSLQVFMNEVVTESKDSLLARMAGYTLDKRRAEDDVSDSTDRLADAKADYDAILGPVEE